MYILNIMNLYILLSKGVLLKAALVKLKYIIINIKDEYMKFLVPQLNNITNKHFYQKYLKRTLHTLHHAFKIIYYLN